MPKIQLEQADLEAESKQIAVDMKAAVSVVGKAGAGGDLATERLSELQDRASHSNRRLGELRQQLAVIEAEAIDAEAVESAVRDFDPLWEKLSTWEQERFIRTLVEHVRYDGKTGTVTLGVRSVGMKELCGWAPALMKQHEHTKRRS